MMTEPVFKKILSVLLAVGGVCLQAASGDAPVIYQDAIVAVIDGEPITGHLLQEEIKSSNILQQFKGGATRENMQKARVQVLDKIIEQEVLFREFKELKASIPGQMIQERLDQMVLQQADGNMERFEDILYHNRMTVSELKKKIYKRMASEMLLYDRVQRDIQVSEPEIEAYYRNNPDKFRQKAAYRLQEIQLKKDGRYAGRLAETWKQIRSELAAGKSFDQLARKYSEDYLAEKGGDMGWQTELNEKLMEKVRNLEKGQIAPGIMSAGKGEYLIRLADRRESGLLPLNEEIRKKILKYLEGEKEKIRYREYMEPLLLKYGVKRF